MESAAARHIASLLVTVSMTVALSCSKSTEPTLPDKDPIEQSPRENQEAEEAALWLSGELYAPEGLYKTIRDDLEYIREVFLDSIPNVSIGFKPWWISSKIGIDVTEKARRMILRGQPTTIDSLNDVFRATRMDTFRLNVGVFTVIYFEGRLHPRRLAEIYGALKDVTYAREDAWNGDWSNVYPWLFSVSMSRTRSSPKLMDTLRCYNTPKGVAHAEANQPRECCPRDQAQDPPQVFL